MMTTRTAWAQHVLNASIPAAVACTERLQDILREVVMSPVRGMFCVALLLATSAFAQTPESVPRARWIEDGLIDAGGLHEGYLFMVRRGGEPREVRQRYERAQSEEVIRRLAQQGIEVFHTHLYKGFGMAAEKSEMDDAVRAAAIAHRYGMKVDSYVQWNSLMYETFFAEEPRAQNWVQRDELGRPILLGYGYQQSFRYRPCFANQEYLDYLKKVVRFAVEEVKTDFLHFDNFDLNAEPESCHDAVCTRGFREFLRRKYTAKQRRERLGFENMDYVNPPQWNKENPPSGLRVIFDPLIQEWIDFRCQVMADALRQVAAYAKSLNAEVVIEINPGGITGANRAWESGIDHARLLPYTQAFWSEEANQPGLTPDGRLVSRVRSYKLARAFRNILLTYTAGDSLALAECLAFNQTLGCVGSDPLDALTRKYIDFYRAHRDLFRGTQDAGQVALLRSYPSITYDHPRAQLSAVLAEQALIETHVPFDLVFDKDLDNLGRHKVLILPDSECLSDVQLATIGKFVEQGGGLLALGKAGLYDQWRRPRAAPGLAGLVDGQRSGSGYEESPQHVEEAATATRKEVGRGRTVFLASLRFDGPLPEFGSYFEIRNRFWKRPANWAEFIDAIRWAAREELPVRVDGPHHLVVNLVAQPKQHRLLLHMINYSRTEATIDDVKVECRMPLKTIRVVSPDSAEAILAARPDGRFVIPPIRTYSIAVLESIAER